MDDRPKKSVRKSRRLTAQERTIEDRLELFPLASGQNLDRFYREDVIARNRILAVLKLDGLVGGMDAGVTHRRRPRYWTVDRSRGRNRENPAPRHPTLVHALLTHLALVESTYLIIEAALRQNPRRTLQDLQWRFEPAIDVIARFNDGWLGFKWSGIWQGLAPLVRQMRGLVDNLQAWNRPGPLPFPGKLCFVVPDLWQAELVRRAVNTTAYEDMCLIHVAGDGLIDANFDLSGSRGRPPRPDIGRWQRPPDRLDSLMFQLMENENARDPLRFMTTVEQWPGAVRPTVRNLTRLNGKAAAAAEALLVSLDLVWFTSAGGFGAGRDWLSIAARRDLVWSGKPSRLFGREKVEKLQAGRYAKHEKGLSDLAGWFAAEGCPVANGWRFRDVMGKDGQLAPDAMIYVNSSPFGPTWFYVEYELSANSDHRVGRKCNGYRSETRSDDFPVLVVCRQKALRRFIDQGTSRMLIAPVEDVRRANVVGDAGTVWLHEGRPVLRFGK